jgi:Cof subfamily protein (haloacid dehalogenase superfamily)
MFQIQASGKISGKKADHKRSGFKKTTQEARTIYKLAAIDLDGTLLNCDRRISDENKAAVAKLSANDIEVVLASGRKHEDILRFHQELELESPILSCHGALVKDPASGEVISSRFIDREVVMHLIKEAVDNELSWVVYDQRGVHLCRSEYWLSEYIRRTCFDRPNICNAVEDYVFTHAEKVNWMGDEEVIRQQFRRMYDAFAGKLTTVITDPDHLEFTLHGADKASGLMDLTERMGICQEEVLAFGDSNNDVTMLSWAGLGVAMNHGTTQARLAAKMISAPGDEGASLARAVDSILQAV